MEFTIPAPWGGLLLGVLVFFMLVGGVVFARWFVRGAVWLYQEIGRHRFAWRLAHQRISLQKMGMTYAQIESSSPAMARVLRWHGFAATYKPNLGSRSAGTGERDESDER